MNTERKEKVTVRYTKAELATLDGEAKTLGMSRSEYIRVLMQHGKSRLYIEYLHDLVEQINTKIGELAGQKAAPETAALSQDAATVTPDVLQRILTGLQVLRRKVEHIEGFVDGRAITAFGSDPLHKHGVNTLVMEQDAIELFCRKFKK
jgi:hypothetical protein